MAEFADLTEYEYVSREPGVRNVGWLGRGAAFPTAPPSQELLRALARAARQNHNVMRGLHNCEFCDRESSRFGVYIDEAGVVRHWDTSIIPPPAWLGTGEIRVTGPSGITYAAPSLVVHYVLDHSYAPPQEFVDAVLREFGDASVLPSD